jgi:septal ring factor EnvC (AmiA/AmiB activator)
LVKTTKDEENLRSELGKSSTNNENLKYSVNELSQKVNVLESALDNSNGDLHCLETSIDKLRAELNSTLNENQTLSNTLGYLKKDDVELRSHLKYTEEEKECLKRSIGELNDEAARLTNTNKSQGLQLTDELNALDVCREELRIANEDNIRLKSLNRELDNDKNGLEHDLNKHCHELGLTKKDLGESNAQNVHLAGELDHLLNCNKQYQEECRQKDRANENIQRSLNEFETELNSTIERLRTRENELSEKNQKLRALASINDELSSGFEKTKHDLSLITRE